MIRHSLILRNDISTRISSSSHNDNIKECINNRPCPTTDPHPEHRLIDLAIRQGWKHPQEWFIRCMFNQALNPPTRTFWVVVVAVDDILSPDKGRCSRMATPKVKVHSKDLDIHPDRPVMLMAMDMDRDL
jgi:hypothetical protein